MTKSCQIPLPAGSPEKIQFPDRCVCCGAPHQADSPLAVSRLVMRGQRQEAVILRYAVPHCERCHRGTNALFWAGMVPFLTGFILLGGAAFVAMAFYANALGIDQNNVPGSANSLVVGAAAGLVVGLISAFLFEAVARLLLLPFFGQFLWRAPLLITQFFQDADYVAGLTGRLDAQAAHLLLTFQNDELAETFLKRNPEARSA